MASLIFSERRAPGRRFARRRQAGTQPRARLHGKAAVKHGSPGSFFNTLDLDQ